MKKTIKRILMLTLCAAMLVPTLRMTAAYEEDPVCGWTVARAMSASTTDTRTAACSAEHAPLQLEQIGVYGCELIAKAAQQIPSAGELVVEKAMEFLGHPYVYGGTRPSGFDCSGFVYYIYKQFGYELKPGADNQWSTVDNFVSRDELQPGDLIFFSTNGRYSGINHIGIYIGNNQIIHASTPVTGVIISSLSNSWYANRYYGAQRVLAA